MAAPPIAERHLHHFHRRSPIKELVRVATTANITIATALNNGDTLDGITLATDDRVLVKDQSSGAQNGIYVVGTSPARSYDVSTDDPAFGYLVLVLQGTTNAGTLWQNTNTSAPTIGSTALTFAQFSSGGSTDLDTILAASAGEDIADALTGAASPTAGNVFATMSDVPGGGGPGAIKYPGLKPGTPTYDFAGSALDGAFSAYSTQGSFVTGDVITQGDHWGGSSVDMDYSAQMGGLYVSHGNTDLDFTVGGMGIHGNPGSAVMIGIAALNSSGTGIGVTAYTDTNCYFAAITTYGYVSNSDSWGGYGLANGDSQGDYWFRLKRVSGTWTGYVSRSGRAWDKTFSTRADSITVDRLVFGILFLTATAYNVRVWADYFQVDV